MGRILIAAALLGSVGCDESGHCGELQEQLLELIRTECPPASACQGNPGLDRPTVPFAEHHYKLLHEMEQLDCSDPDLGQAPWFCNRGEPACPTGYTCCFESLSDICRKGCRTGDAGSTGG